MSDLLLNVKGPLFSSPSVPYVNNKHIAVQWNIIESFFLFEKTSVCH